jgi:sugar phosphate isomerase/epimerase
MSEEILPIGVFTSAGAGLGAALDKVLEVGVSTVQLHTPGKDGRTRENAWEIARRFADAGVEITLLFCGFAGDRYDTIPIVRDTVGLVPPDTRPERVRQTREMADFANWVGAPGIGIHIGFVSEDTESPDFAAIVDVARDIADHCADLDLTMNLETGQESAHTLLALLQAVDRPNLSVNFDPANMILYGSGEPLEALRMVGSYVRSAHCKDATWSTKPREEWGLEVPLGEGDVNIREFVTMLHGMGYTGPLTIEREVSGDRQIRDIKRGIEFLRQVKAELGVGD